jgi:hypothetical protein
VTLLVDRDPVNITKFASSEMLGFRKDEFVAIVLTMGVVGMGRLGRCEDRVLMGRWVRNYSDAPPCCESDADKGLLDAGEPGGGSR